MKSSPLLGWPIWLCVISLFMPSAVHAEWTAYNDVVYAADQYIGEHVTTYGTGDGFTGSSSGSLINHADGAVLPVTVTLTQSGGVGFQPEAQYGGSDTAVGTDAYNTFHGITDMTGVLTYGSLGWTVEITFSGLTPGANYTFATSSARNDYPGRLTIYTLIGADTYTHAGTPGVDVLSEDSVRFNTGGNHDEGYVARWTNITAADGTFTVRAQADPSSPDGTRAYSFDVFMLREDAPPRPAGDLDGNDRIDIIDLLLFSDQWLTNPGQEANLNGDSIVDLWDFDILAGNWLLDWQSGSLQVNITPAEAAAAGAQWSIDGEQWFDSGHLLTDIPVGSYGIQFREISGWHTPGQVMIDVPYKDTAVVEGPYVLMAGTLQVILDPQGARDAGAQWSIDGQSWYDSGYTLGPVPVGSYIVIFSTITGWNPPQDASVEISDGQSALVNAAYEQQTGTLTVTIEPQGARDAGAQWSVDGTLWHDSGAPQNLPIGDYTVQFRAAAGWNAPPNENVTMAYQDTVSVAGTYVQQIGQLTVSLNPAEVRDGARWSIDGVNWYGHEHILTDIPAGDYTIRYNAVPDWTSPANESITITDGANLSASGTYLRKTGSVTVTLNPESIRAQARWSLDGSTWHESGYSLGPIPTGAYTVQYSSVSGWTTPGSQPITVSENQTTTVSAEYIQQVGSLTVTIQPSEIQGVAQWSIDGATWYANGHTIDPLPAGPYTVQFNDVVGWIKPIHQQIAITDGAMETMTGIYAQQGGSLTVTIEPADVRTEARWSIDGTSWYESGQTVSPLAIGDYTVQYNDVTGWRTPADETVVVVSGQNTSTNGTYESQVGDLTVTINPAQVQGQAQWSLDGTTWHNSGHTLIDLAVGDYTIQFSNILGWNTPANESVTIVDAQTASVDVSYVQQTGALTVTIEPGQAVTDGAQWSIDGVNWHAGGHTIDSLAIGEYTVQYSSIAGWNKPADQEITISEGATAATTGTYVQQGGSLTVIIQPLSARSAGAQWNIDGSSWHNSGHTIAFLPVGSYTVQFNTIDGWNSPATAPVSITDGAAQEITGIFSQQTGSLTVNMEPADIRAAAQWTIDGITWNVHGDTLTDLAVGWHTVIYSGVEGWIAPADQIVQVLANLNTTTTGLYIQQQPIAPLLISEFLSDNDTKGTADEFLDEDGDESDWIEIYNPTAEAVSLLGWSLRDAEDTWVFPDVQIGSGEFLVVFASNKNRRVPGSELHANFRLAKEGEYLGLIGPDGNTVVHEYNPEFPDQLSNLSYGLNQFSTRLVKNGNTVKYIVPTSSDASLDWTSQGFNDDSWNTGQVSMGFSSTGGGESGLHYEYFEGNWDWLPDFDALTPVKEGTVPNFDISVRNQDDYFGFRFTGYVFVPADGEYTFYTASDDGSRLWIGNTLVVDNDGLHGVQEVGGSIALTAGAHPITVTMFEKGGGEALTVSYQGPGISKQYIPDPALTGGFLTNLLDEMHTVNSSLWLRAEFTIEDPQTYEMLMLRVQYEDGFVAYLNGQEVARANAAGSVVSSSWNAASQTDRPDEQATVFEAFNLTPYLPLLQTYPAVNVLAIQALNNHKDNGEFSILPELQIATNVGIPQYFNQMTPGEFNIPGALGRVGDTKFSHDRGFYTAAQAFNLEITSETSGASIYYTLNGSTPTAEAGTLYAGPIPINGTSIVRAVAIKPGYLSSNIDTQTYIFPDDVILQSSSGQAPGPGWPTTNVNGQMINYGMDPDIVNSPAYSGIIIDALKAIPSFSIVTDLKNLFDPSIGIYVNAYGDGYAWERPASLELIHPDGSEGFQVECGVRIRGGFSRSGDNPKHAFRLFFRNEYGDSKLKYPLFGEEGTDEFDKFDLRTSQNYSWAFQNDSTNTMVREIFQRDSQRDMGQPYTRSRYYHLYINGQYWGLFMTQERSEAAFSASYFGGDRDDYDTIKHDSSVRVATDGNTEAFDQLYSEAMAGFKTHDAYYRVQGLLPDGVTPHPSFPRMVDVDNLIVYMLGIFYSGDRDAPISNFMSNQGLNNFYCTYNRANPDSFRFFRHDGEHTLDKGMADRTGPWEASNFNLAQYFNPQTLHQKLVEHPDYRMRLADLTYKYFYNDGAMTVDHCIERLMTRAMQIETAIVAESARWGDAKRTTPFTRDDHWWPAVNYIVNNYFPSRFGGVLQQLKDRGWYPDADAPGFNQQGGDVPAGFNLTMNNPNGSGTIYYTLDGSDPRISSALSSPGQQITLISEEMPKYVHVPTGTLMAPKGSVMAEYYFGISTGTLDALHAHSGWPDNPDMTETRTSFEIPTDWQEYYGTRIRAYLHPTATGNYTFWIASDDYSGLWLSSDANPANVTRIAYVDGWTSSRQWSKYASQRSIAIPLQAGQIYYIEAQQAEGNGGDNLAVAWQKDGTNNPQVIPGSYLSSAGIGWVLPDFDHSSWNYGTGIVGFETQPGDPVNYSSLIDINVQSAMYNNNATCLMRIPFEFDGGDLTQLTLKVRYDDGFIAYLNGSEILRVNFDGAALADWNSAANASHDDALAVQQESFDLSGFISSLKRGTNILAIHGLNRTADNSDFLLGVELLAYQLNPGDVSPAALPYSGPVTLTESRQVKARVLDGQWSPLHEAVFNIGPVADSLRITEIMYHPQDPNHEYVELQNVGSQTINLNLVQFTRGIDFTFGLLDLSPDQHVLVVRNEQKFLEKYPDFVGIIAGQFTGALDNAGETIRLDDALGRSIMECQFKDGWYGVTDGEGFSLTLRDPYQSAADYSSDGLVAHWRFDETSGTTVYDSAGTHTGTMANMDDSDHVVGRFGNGLDFDGSNDHVRISGYKGITGPNARTVAAWIRTGVHDRGDILSWGSNSVGRKWLMTVQNIFSTQGTLQVDVGSGYVVGGTPLWDGQWHHIAAVLPNDGTPNANEILLYVDGRRETIIASAVRAVDTASSADVKIGIFDDGLLRYFQGQIDNVAIFDRALEESEIERMVSEGEFWGSKESWRPSSPWGGSPGWDDALWAVMPDSIVINEVLAHSHLDAPDWIEFRNLTNTAINLGGWFLSDSDQDDASRMKYEIAPNTILPANGYLVFYEDVHFGVTATGPGTRHIPFGLSEGGDDVYLRSGFGGYVGGFKAKEDFGASDSGIAFGRYLKSSLDGGVNFVAMSSNTPGYANEYPKVGPVLMTEIVYHPDDANTGGEYIELKNISTDPVALQSWVGTEITPGNVVQEIVAWKFSDGIDFTFPPNTIIPAGGYLILAKNPAAFTAYYGSLPGVQVLGPFENDTSLDNGGERIQLVMPGDKEYGQDRYWIRLDRVSYDDEFPWPIEADGLGKSLSQKTPGTFGANYGNDVENWQATNPNPG
ncbi:MAG: lamin tail domain-containing protein, partial [Sedimentisphaerales bacterium]|nr:lamin tail domain-containing protein [Sedimentisphaerales bacterium]